MNIETIEVGPFLTNAYILHHDSRKDAVVIDPGGDAEVLLALLADRGLTVTHILNTHGHGDHIGANGSLKAAFPDAKLCIHPRDANMLENSMANLSAAFGLDIESPPADVLLEGNTSIEAAGTVFDLLHLPGHSPGSLCFVPELDEPMVFSGDTLFAGSIGRTDFPGGNMGMLTAGIREKLFALDEETVVYAGHGPATTVGVERRTNPFVADM